MERILIIADNYPSRQNPTRGIFVYNIVQEFAGRYEVDVICPTPFKLGKHESALATDKAGVRYPHFLSLSKAGKKRGLLYTLTTATKKMTVTNLIDLSRNYKFVYCHFLSSAIPVSDFCQKNNLPLFVAMGESSVEIRYQAILHNKKYLRQLGNSLTGVIAVSEKLSEFCLKELGMGSENILISPNATDTDKFKPLKVDRSFLEISENDTVISFVGAFVERKGVRELIEAVSPLPGVKLILIGQGDISVDPQKIAFMGRLPHEEIPKYLNASDIFVFPTKAEGSSNAIAEAMACGLPIITSNIPEVVFQVGRENAVFVAPDDVNALRNAIMNLAENKELRRKYSEKSLEIASKRTIENRAKQILEWIETKTNTA